MFFLPFPPPRARPCLALSSSALPPVQGRDGCSLANLSREETAMPWRVARTTRARVVFARGGDRSSKVRRRRRSASFGVAAAKPLALFLARSHLFSFAGIRRAFDDALLTSSRRKNGRASAQRDKRSFFEERESHRRRRRSSPVDRCRTFFFAAAEERKDSSICGPLQALPLLLSALGACLPISMRDLCGK